MKINQSKLEVHDTYKIDGKITTNFKAVDDEDVINKAYIDEKLKKIDGHISYLGKHYNEFKLQYNRQSREDNLFQRALKQRYKYFMIRGYLIIMLMLIKF